MSKKKKTRRQKEKAIERRRKTLQHLGNNSSVGADLATDKQVEVVATTLNEKQSINRNTAEELAISADLKRVAITVVFLAAIIVTLVITDQKFHYLNSWAEKIMGYLVNL